MNSQPFSKSARTFFLFVAAIGIAAAILELGIRVFTPYPNNLPRSNLVYDAVLGFRLRPHSFESNTDGFRSPEGAVRAHIVAIGDSHTFGGNVGTNEAWPTLLAAKMQEPYYNFGVPGYNIVEYQLILKQAFRLDPSVAVLAVYPYNDFESFCRSYIAALDRGAGLKDQTLCAGQSQNQAAPAGRWWDFSAAMSLARDYARKARTFSPRLPLLGFNENIVFRVSSPGREASFVLPDRAAYLDKVNSQRHDKVDAERFFRGLISDFNNHLAAHRSRGLVVIIPSKDKVYGEWAKTQNISFPNEILDLISYEDEWTIFSKRVANDAGLPTCDLIEPLVELVSTGGKAYPQFENSHPIAPGYAVYARAIASCLESGA
jgi:hypothetical protein